jgi:hypothetical protein
MGSTNLRESLQTKMGHWKAEVQGHTKEIARIESLFEKLDDLRIRADHLNHVLECAAVVMKEVNPDWSPDQLKPIKKNVHKAPLRPGQVTRLALDVLRQASEPMPTRRIAIEILRLGGQDNPDSATIQAMVNAVGSTLKAKMKDGLVKHDDRYGRAWLIAV